MKAFKNYAYELSKAASLDEKQDVYADAVSQCTTARDLAACTANLGGSAISCDLLTAAGVVYQKPDAGTVVYNYVYKITNLTANHARVHLHHAETYFFATPEGVRRCGIKACRFNKIVRVSDDPEVSVEIDRQQLNK